METLQSEDWQQDKHLSSCMVHLYDRCLWTDVKFRCKDDEEGETIGAHKIVLAARSPVFQAMFFGPCADVKDEIELKDTEKEIFLLLLRYLYSDTVTLTKENAFAVLEMAHYYQVMSLVQFCADYLVTVITPDNACEILTFAMFYKLTSLQDACCSFIDNHAHEVLQTEGFMNLSDDCLFYILRGDTLFAEEEVILEVADTWSRRKVVACGMEENGTNIRQFLSESFYYLRLPTMSYEKLLEFISRKGYFSVEEYADIAAQTVKMPDICVSTNSCVARVPERETLVVNTQDGKLVVLNKIDTSFDVSVSKNVLLSNFVLGEIHPYLKNQKAIYTDEGYTERFIGGVRHYKTFDKQFDYDEYVDRVIKLATADKANYKNYFVRVLRTLDGFILPDYLGLNMSGSVSIRGLDFRQTFEIQQLQDKTGKVNLNTPLLLKKRSTPYTVDFNLRYSCNNDLHLKARASKSTWSICNGCASIQVRSVSGAFAGIKSIGFVNFSNRDVDKHDLDSKASDVKNEEIESNG